MGGQGGLKPSPRFWLAPPSANNQFLLSQYRRHLMDVTPFTCCLNDTNNRRENGTGWFMVCSMAFLRQS